MSVATRNRHRAWTEGDGTAGAHRPVDAHLSKVKDGRVAVDRLASAGIVYPEQYYDPQEFLGELDRISPISVEESMAVEP